MNDNNWQNGQAHENISGSQNVSGEYHYSYRPAYVQPEPPTPPKKKKEVGIGKVIAIAICVAILFSGASSLITVALMRNTLAEEAKAIAEIAVNEQLKNLEDNTGVNTNITINDESDAIAESVATKVLPSVVGIKVSSLSNNSFYGQSGTYQTLSEGTGVIYTADGYIITNYHVIADAVNQASYGSVNDGAKIEVYFYNEIEAPYQAKVIGYDSSADVALLKVERTGLTPAEIGDSDEIQVGQVAIAVGCPGGLDFMGSVSKGIISGLNRTITTESGIEMNLLQTDAAINPGNSGGALVDSEGKLIGINNAKMAGDGFEGMGFAIPVNEAVSLCERFIEKQGTAGVSMGVSINSYYTSDRLQSMGYPAGVVVYSVVEGSPAAAAGIQANDIITAINGKVVTDYASMVSEKNKYDAGTAITLTIYRNRTTFDVQITLITAGG